MDKTELINFDYKFEHSKVHFIPKTNYENIEFALPPSKSHLIRILGLASINNGTTSIKINGPIGQDVNSMINCLITLGVAIKREFLDKEVILKVNGLGNKGFLSGKTINCGNSGTALRILMTLVSSIPGKTVIKGDKSLSMRENDSLKKSLKDSGVTVVETSDKALPIEITGPWFGNKFDISPIKLDLSKSSQPLTAWLISSSLLSNELSLLLSDKKVSKKHYELSKSLCEKFGANLNFSNEKLELKPYDLSMPSKLTIPGDASMISFAILISKLHNCKVKLFNCPNSEDFLGCEILERNARFIGVNWVGDVISPISQGNFCSYDLTDCNDLITPLAITLAISSGGILTGISHTRYKESDRLQKTIDLMNDFGMKTSFDDGNMVIEGKQVPKKPKSVIKTYGDHRIYMSAVLLLSLFGGELDGLDLHEIADPKFLNRLGLS